MSNQPLIRGIGHHEPMVRAMKQRRKAGRLHKHLPKAQEFFVAVDPASIIANVAHLLIIQKGWRPVSVPPKMQKCPGRSRPPRQGSLLLIMNSVLSLTGAAHRYSRKDSAAE